MPEQAPQPVTAIPHDLACPQCGYNLRGLHGYIVDCPECGARCDVAMLMTRQWTRPWFHAPGFSTVSYTVLWLVGAGFVGLLTPVLGQEMGASAGLGGVLVVTLLLACWVMTVRRACQWFGASEGLGLVAMAHVLFAGYLAGGIAVVVGLLHLLLGWTRFVTTPSGQMLTTVPLAVVIGALVVWLCRRGERFIAGRCIRRHLRGAAVTA